MNAPLLVVGLGEALFDQFENQATLGGAVLNVAVHAGQLLAPAQGQSALVSRIGRDALGRRLRQELAGRHIDLHALQEDANLPTGTVTVQLDPQNQPTYCIRQPVAWDRLRFNHTLQQLAERAGAVCFGTLAQREALSRHTIQRFLRHAPHAIRLLDVNLRMPRPSRDVIEQSLHLATMAKMNLDELDELSQCLNLPVNATASLTEKAQALRLQYELNEIAITRGPEGIVLCGPTGITTASPITMTPPSQADPVGAGDACSAALLAGSLMNMPRQQTLDLANQVGAFVASQPGATPTLPDALIQPIHHLTPSRD
jgi:fructokinase